MSCILWLVISFNKRKGNNITSNLQAVLEKEAANSLKFTDQKMNAHIATSSTKRVYELIKFEALTS